MIAENVVAAFEREREGAGFHETGRSTVMAALMRDLLAVMPTTSPNILVAACNRALDDTTAAMGMPGPRVAAIDLGDGSVTMRS
ncbi:hypothetical protein [Methylobacterium cerastii]|uniref:hypothetical protein n=1 Tax=Methylobacterium cerastii TaxID=932741 RepID=UPI001EE224B5|nr:hypothetical protein [Methylobacterium cerastii]